MEYKVGDLVKLDKKHPCGCNIWEIIRIGMDIKLRCNKCHHIIILGRAQFVDLLVSVSKREQYFKLQQEYRLMINKNVSDHYILDIGDLSDITEITDAEQILNTKLLATCTLTE